MIDLHCHLLPGIDDGPETLEQALALARHAAASGIAKSVVTPHILPGRYENNLQGIRNAAEHFSAQLRERNIPLEIGYAAEVRIGPEVLDLCAAEQMPFLGEIDGYRVVLIEFPDSHILPGTDKLLGNLLKRNIRPLIAHPERNKDVMRDVGKIAPFVQMGCWLQLTAGSVTGVFGPTCQERSRQILERGWAAILASDAHNMYARRPELEAARAAAEDIVGERESWLMVRGRPGQIAENNSVHAKVTS